MTQIELQTMNRDQLRKLASEVKLAGRGTMNKAQLLEALTSHFSPPRSNNPLHVSATFNRLNNKMRKQARNARKAARL